MTGRAPAAVPRATRSAPSTSRNASASGMSTTRNVSANGRGAHEGSSHRASCDPASTRQRKDFDLWLGDHFSSFVALITLD
jgi:hypothetical protein